MAKNWHWIELIGFDNGLSDYGVADFLSRLNEKPEGVSLLFSHIDFVNDFVYSDKEYNLLPCDCSYSGHKYSLERCRQDWTNLQLKGLIEELHKNDVKVIFSIFNFFEYTDDGGNVIRTKYCSEHKELYCLNNDAEIYEHSIHILKRLSSGEFYEDYFISKTKEVIDYYNFDGIQVADGISCNRPSIQNGDFSDDTVSQFVSWLKKEKKEVSSIIEKAVGANKSAYKIRRKYIIENLYFEFICFTNERWKSFYDKFYSAISPKQYLIFINSFWTREPFEAFYRYGIDYNVAYKEGVYALMVEEVSVTNPTLSKEGRGGFNASQSQTRYVHYEFYLMQMLLKAYIPNFKQISILPIGDTQEQWNAIHEAYNELKRAVYRRNNCKVFIDKVWKPCAQAPFFCLSDGVSKNDWNMLSNLDNLKVIENIKGVFGYTLYYPKTHIKEDVERYIKTREYNFHKLSTVLLSNGLDISSVITEKDLSGYEYPILALFPEFYDESEIQALKKTKSQVVYISNSKVIGKCLFDGEIKISTNSDKCDISQVKAEKLKRLFGKKDCDLAVQDVHGSIWTATLKYKEWNKPFIVTLTDLLNSLLIRPQIVKETGCECKITSFLNDDGKIIILISNDEYHSCATKIKMHQKIKSVRSLTKYEGYKIQFSETLFTAVVPFRGMEVVEVEVENLLRN